MGFIIKMFVNYCFKGQKCNLYQWQLIEIKPKLIKIDDYSKNTKKTRSNNELMCEKLKYKFNCCRFISNLKCYFPISRCYFNPAGAPDGWR